jgi:GT2 family glycosyltransferase
VLKQNAPNIRVAVVDDGSTDLTPQLKDEFPKVQWTRWGDNRGLIEARNYLMRSSNADYFVSLDDDAFFMKGDEISIATEFLEQHQSVAAIAFDILSPDKSEPKERGRTPLVSMFIGCGHVVRLAAARAVGFYETTPGLYGGEEKDLCLRLIDQGYEIALLSGVHVWHDKTSIERYTPAQHRSGVCNDLAMTLRRTPSLILPIALVSKLYRHLAFSARHRLIRPCLEGFALFLRSTPKIWGSRKPVKTASLRTFMQLRAI